MLAHTLLFEPATFLLVDTRTYLNNLIDLNIPMVI
jgi:hypothetical protein